MEYSFNTFNKLLEICEKYNKKLYEIMQEKEAYDFEITVEDVREKTYKTIAVMKSAINNGLNSQEESYSGLSGDNAYKLFDYYKNNNSLLGNIFKKVTCYALATAEENIRMNKIAACPTAGSCGIVPAVLVALAEKYNLDKASEIDALITAGTIGYAISSKVAMAGAVAGCQAECGVASAMASAMAVQIMGGNCNQSVNAAALAIKNIFGLTCDPVAGLVEIPCIKRNAFLAIHALTAAELSLAGIETKIPPDEVVDTMLQTGQLMSPLLKETSQGGLAVTKTGQLISETLKNK